MTIIGIGGFSALERARITRIVVESFPKINVQEVVSPDQSHEMLGVLLDVSTYYSWRRLNNSQENLDSDASKQVAVPINLLVFVQSEIDVPSCMDHCNTVRIVKDGEYYDIEEKIREWVKRLIKLDQKIYHPHNAVIGRHKLSNREIEIIELLKLGASNDDIAAELGIRTSTVKTFLRRIYVRLNARNRAHLVALFLKQDNSPAKNIDPAR